MSSSSPLPKPGPQFDLHVQISLDLELASDITSEAARLAIERRVQNAIAVEFGMEAVTTVLSSQATPAPTAHAPSALELTRNQIIGRHYRLDRQITDDEVQRTVAWLEEKVRLNNLVEFERTLASKLKMI